MGVGGMGPNAHMGPKPPTPMPAATSLAALRKLLVAVAGGAGTISRFVPGTQAHPAAPATLFQGPLTKPMTFPNDLSADIKRHRIAGPLFLMAILAMVILPLPPILLDVLFTFNIVLALVVILVSVNSRRPLDFSVFPSIILATP